MGTHLLFQHFSTATFRLKWVFWGNYWVRWPPWITWLAHCGAWGCPFYHLGYVAGTERPIGPVFSHRRACLSPNLILLIFPIFPDWAGVCCILFPQDFKKGFEGKNKKNCCILQVVLCQINIFYHEFTQNTTTDFLTFFRFTQIFLKLKPLVFQVLNFRTIL